MKDLADAALSEVEMLSENPDRLELIVNLYNLLIIVSNLYSLTYLKLKLENILQHQSKVTIISKRFSTAFSHQGGAQP
jgi:hypothetical protein